MRALERTQKTLTLEAGPDDQPILRADINENGGDLFVYMLALEDGKGAIRLQSSKQAYTLAQAATAIGDFLKAREEVRVVKQATTP